MKPRRALFLSLSFIGLFVAASAASQPIEQSTSPALPGNNLAPLLSEQRTLLQQYGLAPIIVSRGERVGDTFDPTTLILIAGADDCFPGLQPRRAAAQLPTVSGESARGLAAALGVAGVIDVAGAGGINRSFELSFQDVEAVTASVVHLRSTLRRGVPECDSLLPHLTAASAKGTSALLKSKVEPPLLIGTLFLARRVVRVSTVDQAGAKAQISWFEDLLRRAGLVSSFKVGAEALYGDQSKIELKSEKIVPVAFSPAFIKKTVTVTQQNTTTIHDTHGSSIAQNVVNPKDEEDISTTGLSEVEKEQLIKEINERMKKEGLEIGITDPVSGKIMTLVNVPINTTGSVNITQEQMLREVDYGSDEFLLLSLRALQQVIR
jgi:hypothetical protein